MHEVGIRIDDAKYIGAYEAYHNMMGMNVPRKKMYAFIRREFGVSRSNMQNIAERFERLVDNDAGVYGDE